MSAQPTEIPVPEEVQEPDGERTCTDCGKSKSIALFKLWGSGRLRICQECYRARHRNRVHHESHVKNMAPERPTRDANLWRLHEPDPEPQIQRKAITVSVPASSSDVHLVVGSQALAALPSEPQPIHLESRLGERIRERVRSLTSEAAAVTAAEVAERVAREITTDVVHQVVRELGPAIVRAAVRDMLVAVVEAALR